MATQAIAAQAGFDYGRGSAVTERGLERIRERNQLLMAAQQRARRGPVPEALFTKRFDNSRLVKVADPQRTREMGIFVCAMVLMFCLSLAYGWQHLSGINAGYRIETEKAQLQQLQEQNRQLRLTEAQLVDPARIDQLARGLGLSVPVPGQVVRPDAVIDPSAPVLAETHPLLPAIR